MASQEVDEVIFERRIAAPLEEVYAAWVHAALLREWLCDGATVGTQPGQRYVLWWNDGYTSAGAILGHTPYERLAFSWMGSGDPAPTQVDVLLHAADEENTQVSVRHSDLGKGKEWESFRKEIAKGWERGLENLQSILETGEDLRLTRRPILGIAVGAYSPEIAGRLGIPGVQGVRVEGVSEQGGARQAGLRADDVIVELAGAPVTGWASLSSAMEQHEAGETVAVVFMRDGNRRTAQVQLAARSLPDVRDRSLVLRTLAEGYRRAYDQIAALLDGVSDERALRRPAPTEWSALETIAHLILVEREAQSFVGDLLNRDERWSDENPTNILARVAAVAAAYPTAPAMLRALNDTYTETQALIAALPESFLRRRGSWTRAARSVLGLMEHADDHLAQIRSAL
jgi:uncharacterized protein YndB with AHSA1/START domain